MNDRELTILAVEESEREEVSFPYRLIVLRQREHEKAGRLKEAVECACIKRCLEIGRDYLAT